MISLTSTVLLALASVAHARFNRFQPRVAPPECCPCPGFKNDEVVTTVTVTEAVPAPAPVTIYVAHFNHTTSPAAKTVTVHRTITEAPLTVYVTLGDFAAPSGSERIEQVKMVSNLEPPTVTVYVDGPGAPPAPGSKNNGEANNEGAKDAGQGTGNTDDQKNDQQDKYVVLETMEAVGSAPNGAGTNLVTLAPAAELNAAVSSTLAPAATALIGGIPGHAMEEAVDDPAVTIAASPSMETMALGEAASHYQTMAQSIHNGDNIDIKITVINIDTGDETCTIQGTGLPCEGDISGNTTAPFSLNSTSSAQEPSTGLGFIQVPTLNARICIKYNASYSSTPRPSKIPLNVYKSHKKVSLRFGSASLFTPGHISVTPLAE